MPYIEFSSHEIGDAIDCLKEGGVNFTEVSGNSLVDEIKIDSFFENINRIPLDKFEGFLKTLPL